MSSRRIENKKKKNEIGEDLTRARERRKIKGPIRPGFYCRYRHHWRRIVVVGGSQERKILIINTYQTYDPNTKPSTNMMHRKKKKNKKMKLCVRKPSFNKAMDKRRSTDTTKNMTCEGRIPSNSTCVVKQLLSCIFYM